MEKLNRAQKCSILGPQNLGSGGARAPGAPPGSTPVSHCVTAHIAMMLSFHMNIKQPWDS